VLAGGLRKLHMESRQDCVRFPISRYSSIGTEHHSILVQVSVILDCLTILDIDYSATLTILRHCVVIDFKCGV
jgi:hypothetical protein